MKDRAEPPGSQASEPSPKSHCSVTPDAGFTSIHRAPTSLAEGSTMPERKDLTRSSSAVTSSGRTIDSFLDEASGSAPYRVVRLGHGLSSPSMPP